MTADELLRGSLLELEVNETFTEATVTLNDRSRLRFCHQVGERWVKAEPFSGNDESITAAQVLAAIATFRLNAKHLEVTFTDGRRWEAKFRG